MNSSQFLVSNRDRNNDANFFMPIKRIAFLFLLVMPLVLFQTAKADEIVKAKVVRNEGDLVLILPSPYVIEGAPVSPCTINGRHQPCYVLRKAEAITSARPNTLHPQKIEQAERKEASAAAQRAGLKAPYHIERVPADLLLARFDVTALTTAERNELNALDVRSPLCGRGDGSPMTPCPIQPGTQFGVLRAKNGGCAWSPIYGMPATRSDLHGPFVSLGSLRCGTGDEWDRIQKTALHTTSSR